MMLQKLVKIDENKYKYVMVVDNKSKYNNDNFIFFK